MIKKFNIFSLIIGIFLGALLGYFTGEVITRYFPNNLIMVISISVFVVLGALLGSTKQILTEWIAFVFSAYILFQVLWDLCINDWSTTRLILGASALALFILNFFTGRVKIGGLKIFKRQMGLR